MSRTPDSNEAHASESALIEAVQSGMQLGDGELLDAMMTEKEARQKRNRLQRAINWYLSEGLRKAGLDVRRRSRFVVIIGFLTVPFYGVLVQQLLAHGLKVPALVATCAAGITLLSVLSLRFFKSHIVPGTVICGLISFVIFYQALADAGLNDPILYWSALVPLAAALAVGPRLAVICVILNIAGVVTLYLLTVSGYSFPSVTQPSELSFSALLSISTATLFALIWGWFYEGHTLKELKELNSRLSRFREALARSEE
ncbi:MAG: hypothetical protein R3284_04760, partial [Rubricoccaceae bacterium]|nr:hypothetical protein [Rubricoccaceae bacterium]